MYNDYRKYIVSNQKEESISITRVNKLQGRVLLNYYRLKVFFWSHASFIPIFRVPRFTKRLKLQERPQNSNEPHLDIFFIITKTVNK